LGGRHAIRFNLFTSEQVKRIFTSIVAAMQLQMEVDFSLYFFSLLSKKKGIIFYKN